MSKEFEYKIEYDVDKETGQVTATIPELNHVSSFGDTFAEAEANVKEAAIGYLEVIVKDKGEIPKPHLKRKALTLNYLFQIGLKPLSCHEQTKTAKREEGCSKAKKSRFC
ncbi:MAG: type II toxin-antitoxin system HicB family antitoxin [Candidatus Paceibacter sp.]|nr:type II toxin-antitoxin system HicB family antitoxin [Candidatus Paceibacter sp.]